MRELIKFVNTIEMVYPVGEAPACRDEKDRKFLHCAVTANADYLVTRDTDLLDMQSIGDTFIVVPEVFLRLYADSKQ